MNSDLDGYYKFGMPNCKFIRCERELPLYSKLEKHIILELIKGQEILVWDVSSLCGYGSISILPTFLRKSKYWLLIGKGGDIIFNACHSDSAMKIGGDPPDIFHFRCDSNKDFNLYYKLRNYYFKKFDVKMDGDEKLQKRTSKNLPITISFPLKSIDVQLEGVTKLYNKWEGS